MKPHRLLIPALLVSLCCVDRLPAQAREVQTLKEAAGVLDAVVAMPTGIPPKLLREAQGVAILPNVIKAAFVFGGRHGSGVVFAREANGGWSRPIFVSLTGGGVGWQIGVESTDLILVFMSKQSVQRILDGKGKITLGADVGVAAGPLGRQAEAATDAQLKAEIYSYSRSRGLFAGVSLQGAVLLVNHRANDQYYNPQGQLWQNQPINSVPPTAPEQALRARLSELGGGAHWEGVPVAPHPHTVPMPTTIEPRPLVAPAPRIHPRPVPPAPPQQPR